MGKVFNVIIKIVTFILILALILVAVSLFITPAKIGLQDVEVGGVTVDDMGLSDVTFYNIGKIALGIINVKEEKEVEHEVYKEATEKLPPVANVSTPVEESLQVIAEEPIYFEEEVEVELDSNELTAVVNLALGTKDLSAIDFGSLLASDLAGAKFYCADKSGEITDVKISLSDAEAIFEMSTSEVLSYLQEYGCEFVKIDISTDGEYVYSESKFKIKVPADIVEQINATKVITISGTVYISFDSVFTLADGALTAVPSGESSIGVNSLDRGSVITTANAAIGVLSGEKVDGASVLATYDNSLDALLAKIINNLAYINSIDNGVISMTTRTK